MQSKKFEFFQHSEIREDFGSQMHSIDRSPSKARALLHRASVNKSNPRSQSYSSSASACVTVKENNSLCLTVFFFTTYPVSHVIMLGPVPALPMELYRPIFQEIDSKGELCSLSRVSRSMQAEAERLLYHKLELMGNRDIIMICERIRSTPRIRPYVRECQLKAHWDRSPCLRSFYTLVAFALSKLTNLRRLAILDAFGFLITFTWILKNCRFKLRKFQSHLKFDRNLLSFLESQVELKDLGVLTIMHTAISVNLSSRFSSQFLPNLVILRCINLSSIFSSHIITHLDVHTISEFVLPLPISFHRIVTLRLGKIHVELPDHTPNLEVLSVRDFHGRVAVSPLQFTPYDFPVN
jgi:hypothetical protein